MRVYASPNTDQTAKTNPGAGLLIQGGTGKIGATLTNPSTAQPRLGRPGTQTPFELVVWPATYHIFTFNNPDEVYVVLNFSQQYQYWLAFGMSDVPGLTGTGLWLAGTARVDSTAGSSNNYSGFGMTPATGEGGGNSSYPSPSGFFWCTTRNGDKRYHSDAIHSDFSGAGWQGEGGSYSYSEGSFHAVQAAAPHIAMTPSAWNQDAPLLPIHGYVWRSERKCSLAVLVRNARYIRVDSYEPGDIITLGTEKWIVFPFYFKNTTARDGGHYLNHTGTFGWALRYEG